MLPRARPEAAGLEAVPREAPTVAARRAPGARERGPPPRAYPGGLVHPGRVEQDPQPDAEVRPGSVSVVIPCLNEAETIEECVRRARAVLSESGRSFEVLVVDNGSEDGSAALARASGARVVEEPRRGYGRPT